MNHRDPPRDKLIAELETLRQRVSELEAAQGQRRTAETALRESESRFRPFVETIPHGIQECDTEGRITFANAALHRLPGSNGLSPVRQNPATAP